MSVESFVALVVLAGLLAFVLRAQWNRRNFPLIACGTCHGDSLKTKWIFHMRSLRFRKVGRRCKSCGGSPWTETDR